MKIIKVVDDDDEMSNNGDVEVYASLYSGRTKVRRLMFIADRCDNQTTKLDALRMAYDEIKKGENTNLFKEVVKKIDGKLGSEYSFDQIWVDNVDRKADMRKEKLENELNAYRTNLIKESIRMGYNDFGDFYYARGQLCDAFENYARTRDYCTTSKHMLQMYLNAILVSIEMGQFSRVENYVSKAEQTPDALDPVAIAKLRCAAGLSHLESQKYKLAACKFLETGPELGSTYTEVIAPQDVATYGGLCALASFDRTELKNKVIDNFNFRNFLELVPEVREIVNAFYSSRYASCLEYLENLKASLLLDIHLHDHVETLYGQIHAEADTFHTEAQIKAAKTEVAECRRQVQCYEKAIFAIPYMEKSLPLKQDMEMKLDDLGDIKATLKRNLTPTEKVQLRGQQASLTREVSRLNARIEDLSKYADYGIKGKSREELESLKSEADLKLEKALSAHSRLCKVSRGKLQGFEKKLAAKEDTENSIYLLIRMPDGSRHGRRFLTSDRLQSLFDFIDVGRAVNPGTYRLVMLYPGRVFSDGESAVTLSDLGLTGQQEELFLEFI